MIQREWRRKLAVREVERVRNAAEVRRREQQIQAQKDAITLREAQAREAKLAAARMAREKAALERAKVDEERAQAEVSAACLAAVIRRAPRRSPRETLPCSVK